MLAYCKRMVISTPKMHYHMTLPVSSGHSQASQGTCWNKSPLVTCFSLVCPSESTPKLLFSGCPSPASQQIHVCVKTASSKMFESVKLIFASSSHPHPFPILGAPLSHSSPQAPPSATCQNLLLERIPPRHLYFDMTVFLSKTFELYSQ